MWETQVLYDYLQGDRDLSDRASVLEQMIDDQAGIGDTDKVLSADATAKLLEDILQEKHIYGCAWNQTDATMQRIWDAEDITTDTTNFILRGQANPYYNNPFDDIMPWKGRKACNVDIARYKAMVSSGNWKLTDCIKAYEDDAGFDWNDADGVWIYTPEFWYTVYDRKDGYRIFGVADIPVPGWLYAPESIQGRTFGINETRTVDGNTVHYFLPKAGPPMDSITSRTMLEYVKAYNGTVEDLYLISEENMLYIVEFANMDSQVALGNGVSSLSQFNGTQILVSATDTNMITVSASKTSNVRAGELLYIGTGQKKTDIARSRIITAVTPDSSNSDNVLITFDGDPVTVAQGNYWSMYGVPNSEDLDSNIGSKSGYFGRASYSNAYYRGKVSHGNRLRLVLGAYREASTNHLWISKRKDCDRYDVLKTSLHIDTGVSLPPSGNIKTLLLLPKMGQGPIPSSVGGTTTAPVGDYIFVQNPTRDTVLRVFGCAHHNEGGGRFRTTFGEGINTVDFSHTAIPVLKNMINTTGSD